jgi:hypothetical protein
MSGHLDVGRPSQAVRTTVESIIGKALAKDYQELHGVRAGASHGGKASVTVCFHGVSRRNDEHYRQQQ